MDLKCVLDENSISGVEPEPEPQNITQQDIENDKNIRIHKKPMQLRDIENRSANKRKNKINHETDEKIKDLLTKEKEEVYKQNWNKLDLGMKINRIKLYIDDLEIKHSLDLDQKEKLRILLMKECNSGKLNKNSEITYDKFNCKILSIKNLKFDEQKKDFKLEIVETKKNKVSSSSKSKSNIDRFLKKKN